MTIPRPSPMNVLKGFLGLVAALILLALLDLYTLQLILEDPGPYLVARRSDTPSQVKKALENMQRNHFGDVNKIIGLIRRYRSKIRGTRKDPETNQAWKTVQRKALILLKKARKEQPRDRSPTG